MKLKMILVISLAISSSFRVGMNAQKTQLKIQINTKDSIKNNQANINLLDSEAFKDQPTLDSLIVLNSQLDTILNEIVKKLSDRSILIFFIEEKEYNGDFFLRITGLIPNNEVFDILSKTLPSHHIYVESSLMGFVRYKNTYFYVINKTTNKEYREECKLPTLFKKSKDSMLIAKENKTEYIIYENPIWFYHVIDNRLELVYSANDKGFFTNP